jgi:hypothetical protein
MDDRTGRTALFGLLSQQAYLGSFPSKRQAVCAAIEFGEKDGHAGRRVEVLVGHEDGHFLTEWSFGRDPHRDEAARPIVTPCRK